MTTIYLIRHAEAEGNLYRRIHGWYDALVTENGWKQIKALEARFSGVPVDAVWSSDLYRTRATARPSMCPRDWSCTQIPACGRSTWAAGRTVPGARCAGRRGAAPPVQPQRPAWVAPRRREPGEVGARVERAIRRIAVEHPGQTVAVFSHGTAIRQFLANVKGIPPEEWHALPHADNTSVTCLAWDGEAFHVVFEGIIPIWMTPSPPWRSSPGGGRGRRRRRM